MTKVFVRNVIGPMPIRQRAIAAKVIFHEDYIIKPPQGWTSANMGDHPSNWFLVHYVAMVHPIMVGATR